MVAQFILSPSLDITGFWSTSPVLIPLARRHRCSQSVIRQGGRTLGGEVGRLPAVEVSLGQEWVRRRSRSEGAPKEQAAGASQAGVRSQGQAGRGAAVRAMRAVGELLGVNLLQELVKSLLLLLPYYCVEFRNSNLFRSFHCASYLLLVLLSKERKNLGNNTIQPFGNFSLFMHLHVEAVRHLVVHDVVPLHLGLLSRQLVALHLELVVLLL